MPETESSNIAAAEELFDIFENWADDFSYSYKDRIIADILEVLHKHFSH